MTTVEENTANRASIRRPSLGLLLLEGRALLELAALVPAYPLLRQTPRGDGHPVLVLPGFMASDFSTRALRGFLRDRGYAAHGWKLGRNTGPTPETVAGLRRRLDELRKRYDRRVSVIGWSLGGVYARELARAFPSDVRQVITLASPFRNLEAVNVPAFVLARRRPHPDEAAFRQRLQLPLAVPITAIYSRTDGIASWQSCVAESGPQSESIEVASSHSGIGHHPVVLHTIADRLAQPEAAWKPFRPPAGWRWPFVPRVTDAQRANPAIGSGSARSGARSGCTRMDAREITLHGHRVSYRAAGSGPLLVLIHGIARSSATWDTVLPGLAERHTVVAPDLLGHGESAKPRGDYSLGAYASGLRDLLAVLGYERGTILGHSLGGGVAMQFAYQFPERCERLVLVSSGGLGHELHVLLRAAALPGAEWVLPLLCTPGLRDTVDGVARFLGRVGLRAGPDLEEAWGGFASLADADACQAFIHTVRTVVDVRGQRASATERLYLAAELPTLIIWGAHDPLIPVAHAYAAHERIPGSRLEIFPEAGHFPHRDNPRRFVEVLLDFTQSTQPAPVDEARWRNRLRAGVESSGAPSAAPGSNQPATASQKPPGEERQQ